MSSRTKRVAALALACLFPNILVASTAWGAAAAGPSESAAQVLRAAVASADQEGSVRVTVHFFSGKVTGELVQDSAQKSAVQTDAIGKERISIVLIEGVAYISANTSGLTSYFGLPASVAPTLAGRWISVAPTDSSFASVTAGLTLSSALKEVTPTGSITEGKRSTIDQRSTTSVSGAGSGTGSQTVLFVATKGKPLPVKAVTSNESGGGDKASGEIVTFSRWGEKVDVPTPTDPIPIATIANGASS